MQHTGVGFVGTPVAPNAGQQIFLRRTLINPTQGGHTENRLQSQPVNVYAMRDPKRIHPFLVELEALWKEMPDLRFGQLVSWLYGSQELNQLTEDSVIFEDIQRRAVEKELD